VSRSGAVIKILDLGGHIPVSKKKSETCAFHSLLSDPFKLSIAILLEALTDMAAREKIAVAANTSIDIAIANILADIANFLAVIANVSCSC